MDDNLDASPADIQGTMVANGAVPPIAKGKIPQDRADALGHGVHSHDGGVSWHPGHKR